jgi:exodeoxyribonuclease VII large subunit
MTQQDALTMPETIENIQVFSLLEVTRSIRKTLLERYTSSFWVKAEMIRLNHYTHSGHCYPDLVEKQQGKVIAQIRANLWSRDFIRINNKFLKVLKEPLKDGIKILFLAKVSFDPVYGLSLHLIDIDPSFTLGDLEKEKQETIAKLRAEGLFNKNKTTLFPLLPQRIAVISVETSKGYADFLKVIDNNPRGYRFFHFLFPSILQGEKAIEGIIFQLNRIKKVLRHFDLVAIIRGGGGDVGLSCYNDVQLAREIAQFPLPVVTGIGHATNETVAEMVAFENAITPTKLAEMLIQHFHNFAEPVTIAEQLIVQKSQRQLHDENHKLRSEVKLFKSATHHILSSNTREMITKAQSLSQSTAFIFRNEHKILTHISYQTGRQVNFLLTGQAEKVKAVKLLLAEKSRSNLNQEKNQLTVIEKNIRNLDPVNVMKRGYSITLINGRILTSAKNLKAGEEIETLLPDGKIASVVKLNKSITHE